MQVWNVLHAACWKYRTHKNHHLGTIASDCIFATKACIDSLENNLLNSNISSRCHHNMANFGPLTAEITLPVWRTPASFNRFHVLPSLLQWHCSPEANQTLHTVWPSPRLVHYIYIFGGSCPLMEFCQVQNSLYIPLLRSPILAALLHGTPAAGVSQLLHRGTKTELRNFRTGRHLYLAGWPSRWSTF